MKCYLFLTFAIGGSYPRPKGRELATAHLSIKILVYLYFFYTRASNATTYNTMEGTLV